MKPLVAVIAQVVLLIAIIVIPTVGAYIKEKNATDK